MLLDRIDIDTHGPLKRVELGPLAEHLNVVFAPDGSGKTAITRFVRDALVDRAYPLGMFSSSTGRVVLADRHGMVHCNREQDGTPSGRRRVSFEPRGDFHGRYDLLENPWLRGISNTTDAGRAIASLELPEAIVDGVMTETSGGSVARVVSACVRSGLDSPAAYQDLPLYDDLVYADRSTRGDGYGEEAYERNRRLRRELADVEAELSRLGDENTDYDALMARRNRLTSRLSQPMSQPMSQPTKSKRRVSDAHRVELERRSAQLQNRARSLRSVQSDLRRRLADLELDIASCDLNREHRATRASYERNEHLALCRDRDAVQIELDRATESLDACLGEAAEVARALRSHATNAPIRNVPDHKDRLERDAFESELKRIDQRLSVLSRIQWLQTRRGELLKQLRVIDQRPLGPSPLAEAASRWLVRISGGRLHRVEWTGTRFDRDWTSYHRDTHAVTGVRINGRDETQCGLADRVLTSLAVRMAAGDLLACTGRHVPLLLEIPDDACRVIDRSYGYERSSQAYRESGDHLRSNHPLAAALRDYTQAGRQLLVLTSSKALEHQLARVGARSFQIHAHRVVHSHRPLWRPSYDSETYVGPHPHTYASRDAKDVGFSPSADTLSRDGSLHRVRSHETSPVDVNRDFDVAWRESQGLAGVAPREFEGVGNTSHRTDWARDGVIHRDGYYFADSYTTDSQVTPASTDHGPIESPKVDLVKRTIGKPDSPFYLTVDSPIDQAPSIDAVAAARLRGLKVTHITHLMQSDPNRLSDALGLASVDAATIRRWQAECRLACRVPKLRGFDARILVGCGITTPGQLAAIHPTDLLHEVEAFLSTERGRQVLLSGTSQELSRIMTWIAEANSGNLAGSEDDKSRVSRKRRIIRTMNDPDALRRTGHPLWDDESAAHAAPVKDSVEVDASNNGHLRQKHLRRTRRKQGRRRNAVKSAEPVKRVVQRELRFFLHRDSPIVEAPSIGPRMAERMQDIGIHTVDDFLSADPEAVAADLDHRRVDSDTIVQWQHQAALVCRIPMLRGHDAELLVAADLTTPEELAEADATELFAIVDEIANSGRGKRILRGGNPPDLDEVKDWIHWAKNQRSLRAA